MRRSLLQFALIFSLSRRRKARIASTRLAPVGRIIRPPITIPERKKGRRGAARSGERRNRAQ